MVHNDLLSCDPLSVPTNVEELGLGLASIPAGPFPAGEETLATDTPKALDACGPPGTNILVTMTNLTPFDFQEVWYVGDPSSTFWSASGTSSSGEG